MGFANNYVQQLINTFIQSEKQQQSMFFASVSSDNELLPVHLSLSLALLVLLDWAAQCLDDPQSFVKHFVLDAVEQRQDEINEQEKKLNEVIIRRHGH